MVILILILLFQGFSNTQVAINNDSGCSFLFKSMCTCKWHKNVIWKTNLDHASRYFWLRTIEVMSFQPLLMLKNHWISVVRQQLCILVFFIKFQCTQSLCISHKWWQWRWIEMQQIKPWMDRNYLCVSWVYSSLRPTTATTFYCYIEWLV